MFPHTLKHLCAFWISTTFLVAGSAFAFAQESSLADGVYLYGQSPQPEQLGQEYLVFRVHSGKIKGAIYYPASEFNCFSGSVTENRLSLGIVDPQDEKVYPYSIALQPSSPLARQEIAPGLHLEGYHRLANLSPNDRAILATCDNS